MITNFQRALNFTLLQECEFAHGHDGDMNFVISENVKNDPGGLTKYGIDAKDHPGVDIEGLDLAKATAIYQSEEWTQCRCDELPDGYDIALFDTAVNNGVETAIRLLQRSVNETAGMNLAVDGVLGPATLAAVNEDWPGGVRRFIQDRIKLYYDIVTTHPADSEFIHDWIDRCNDLAAFLGVNLSAISP